MNLGNVGARFSLTADQLADSDTQIIAHWHEDISGSTAPDFLSLNLWTDGESTDVQVGTYHIDLSTLTGPTAVNELMGVATFPFRTGVSNYRFRLYGTNSSNTVKTGTFRLDSIDIKSDDGPADKYIRHIANEQIKPFAQTGNDVKIQRTDLAADIGAGLGNARGALQAASAALPTNPPSGQISAARWDLPKRVIHGQPILASRIS